MSEVLNSSTINNANVGNEGLQVNSQSAVSPAKQTYLGYDDTTRGEIDRFISEFDIRNPEMVRTFGENSVSKNTEYCDKYLDFACNSQAEKEVKESLGKLLDQVNKSVPRPAGFFEKLFLSLEQQQKKLKRKVQSVGDMVDDIESELLSLEKELIDARGDIKAFAEQAKDNLQLLDKYVVAGELILEDFQQTEVPKYKAQMQNASQDKQLVLKEEMEGYQTDLLRQINNIKTVKSIAIVTLMQLFEMAQENKLLYDNIHEAVIHTIPVLKQSCAIALLQARHDIVADTTVSVNKITEQMIQDNTARIGEGYIAALKQSQEGFVSADVIVKVTDQIRSTLEEAKKIQDEGFKKQLERRKALEAGQQSLLTLASGIDRELKLTDIMAKANQLEEDSSNAKSKPELKVG